MGETLEALHRLQEVERQLAGIRRDRESRSKRIEYHLKQVRQIEDQIEQLRRTTREHKMKLDSVQMELASREESIKKHREALNRAKTNREYASLLSTMNIEKADSSRAETSALELMEQIQTIKGEIEKLEEERERRRANATQAEKVLAEFDTAHKERVDDLTAQRNVAAEAIAPTTLLTFTRVAEHLDGEAMASVRKMHPKRGDYVCTGCNMTVTLEVINALQTRDDLQLCKSCGRILYLDPSSSRT